MNGEIYIIKNDINDKVYIGQTTQGSETRFKQHLKLLKSNSVQLIHKAIKKYGKEHFYFDVLEADISIDMLDNREEYWIRYYDSVEYGYNLCYGGHQSRKLTNFKLIEKINKNTNEIIHKYLNENISLRKLEKIYDIPRANISQLLKDNGIEVQKRNKTSVNITENEKLNISIMYGDGMSTKEIANKINRSEATVRRYRNYQSI